MGLLKGLWNGLGDLYDSVDNTSNDDYSDNIRRQGSRKVRVTWRGNYKSTAGYWCSGELDEVIPENMYRRLSQDGRATTQFLKRAIYDSEEFEYENNGLTFVEYVYD